LNEKFATGYARLLYDSMDDCENLEKQKTLIGALEELALAYPSVPAVVGYYAWGLYSIAFDYRTLDEKEKCLADIQALRDLHPRNSSIVSALAEMLFYIYSHYKTPGDREKCLDRIRELLRARPDIFESRKSRRLPAQTVNGITYTRAGHVFITPEDDPDTILDKIVETGYGEENCFAHDFDAGFIMRLMSAGFIIMSTREFTADEIEFLLIPTHHTLRSVLLFENLHIEKSLKRFLPRYELAVDTDFDTIVDKCVAFHDDGWLTPRLVDIIKNIKRKGGATVKPFSFGVYRDGELKAGEFGVICGRVYTSYSGYHDESRAGSVQMILTARYLRSHGFDFWDFGMPLDYKTALGAKNISLPEFLDLYRRAKR
jgi:Leu/Phe-tRNA-protein transferase